MAIELPILWDNGSSSGGSGDGSSSGSPVGEGSGEVPGGDLPSDSGPNNGEPSIPGEGGGNPPIPDSEVGGLPNTEPNLPNSGDNTTPSGATNQSGNVGGNGYGNGYGEGGKYSNINEGLNFSSKAAEHMGESARQVPVQTLQDVIKQGNALPDPRGSSATMYYSQMYFNEKMYNIEVLYDEATNTVYHFEYARKAMGNLPAIKK